MLDVELLAPAGSFKAAQYAIEEGADALYLGLSGVSMRPRRAEFDKEELDKTIKLIHSKGKKAYVVANIFPKSYDVDFFKDALEDIYRMEADAIVVSDIWSLRYVKDNFKNIEAHVSIQASVSSDKTAAFYERNGADVIVVSRSMPNLEDIKRIRKAVSCRLEVFAHGGICFMYDGNCYMSSHFEQKIKFDKERNIHRVYGQNNTKGECHLVCKRPFELRENGSTLAKGCLMRRNDQVGLRDLPLYIESGINIFKLEGRAMADNYVKRAVKLYRQAIDTYLNDSAGYTVAEKWLSQAEDLKEYRLEYERKWKIK